MLVHRLLDGSALRLHVFTDRRQRSAVVSRRDRVLAGEYHYFLKKGLRGNRLLIGRVFNGALNLALAVVAGVQAARLVRAHRVDHVVSVMDDGYSTIAAVVCARLTGAPWVVLVFDLWEENAYTEFERFVARRLERGLLRRARKVVVHCREMADFYRNKHGLAPVVLPTPVDTDSSVSFMDASINREVLYGGAVYWAQADAVERLSRARKLVDGLSFTILGSWARAHDLERLGISVDRLEGEVASEAYRERLSQAAILFVGLSFGSKHPDVIRTAAPAKLVEYMASGRPIVVHAPAGSHLAEYARDADFAAVVDEPDEAALAAALREAVNGGWAVTERVRRAREVAEHRHNTARVQARFRQILEASR